MNIVTRILNKISTDRLNTKWRDMNHILSFKNFSVEYYRDVEHVREAEHQVGRFLNMKKIADEIRTRQLTGDVLEFGSWQGLGLIILGRLLGDLNRKFIGVDSFEGLPSDSNFWRRGMFNNTSEDFARHNVKAHCPGIYDRLHLVKGWFSDPAVKEGVLQQTKNVVLIHFDADLGSSTSQALEIVEPLLIGKTEPVYFLFDDWGCHPDEVPDAFNEWVSSAKDRLAFRVVKLSSTRLTRYYRLEFK